MTQCWLSVAEKVVEDSGTEVLPRHMLLASNARCQLAISTRHEAFALPFPESCGVEVRAANLAGVQRKFAVGTVPGSLSFGCARNTHDILVIGKEMLLAGGAE